MRIISLAPSNTEIIYALGLRDELAAVTHFCDWPEEAQKKPKIGGWINTEPEKIREFKPEVILTSYFLPEVLREWRGPGEIIHVAPTTLEGVYESILIIGEATRRKSQAEQLVAGMQREFEALRSTSSGARVKLYMEEWFQPPMASGNWVPEIVEIAGGKEGIAKTGEPSRAFEFAELAAFDPDLMVFHWCGWGEKFDPVAIKKREGWDTLRAVREQKLYSIHDSLLNRPGPRLVEGAQKLREILARVGARR